MSSPSALAIVGFALVAAAATGSAQAAATAENAAAAIEASSVSDTAAPESLGSPRSLSRGADRAVKQDTGVRSIDMLLDLHATDDEKAAAGAGAASRPEAVLLRPRPAASGVATTRAAVAPLDTSLEEGAEDGVREKRWTATGAAAAGASPNAKLGEGVAEPGQSDRSSGYRGDFDGVDLSRSPTRRLLVFLRQHRDWVLACSVAAVLGLLSLRASMLRRRRR